MAKKKAPKLVKPLPVEMEEVDPNAPELEPQQAPEPPAETEPEPMQRASTKIDLSESSGIKKKTEDQTSAESADAIEELKQEIDDNFAVAYEAKKDWLETAKEDIDFKNGKQWTEEDSATLRGQNRPVLTFNQIKPIVKLITGHLIQNNARITVTPEGGEDQQFSDVSDKLIDFIDEEAQLNFNLGYQFQGGETCGRGWIEFYYDYSEDPIFGQLRSQYLSYSQVFDDPNGTAYDLNRDRAYIFKVVKKTKAQLKELCPKKVDVIEGLTDDTEARLMSQTGPTAIEGDANNYGLDKRKSRTGLNTPDPGPLDKSGKNKVFTTLEYWRVKYVDKWCVYFADKGDMPLFDSEDEANAEIEKRRAEFEAAGGPAEEWITKTVKRKRREMWVAIKAGGELLADGKSPMEPSYNGYPFFQFIADWSPEADNENERIMGMVRALKDPQREKNKARSQYLHILNTSANSGWIIDDDAMADDKKQQLRDFGAVPGIVVQKKRGSEVTKISPTDPSYAQQLREKAASDDFKTVSGINADLMSVDTSNAPSGKAIALRIRQAITILEPDFRNFRYTKKLIGQFLFKVIPTLFDVAKIKKVLGVNYLQGAGIDDTHLKAYLITLEDGRYNVRIAEHGDTKTLREETFEDLMNMVSNGMPIPFEIMADFMTFPNKDEVIKKVQANQAQQQQAAIAAASAKAGSKGGAPGMPGMPAPGM